MNYNINMNVQTGLVKLNCDLTRFLLFSPPLAAEVRPPSPNLPVLSVCLTTTVAAQNQ